MSVTIDRPAATQVALKPLSTRRLQTAGLLSQLAKWGGGLLSILIAPIRLFLSIRSSMTSVSVSLLLLGIVTLNVIWGYPWSGVFSACFGIGVGGLVLNRLTYPKLRVNYSLSSSAPAGQPFAIVTHLHNAGLLPAMELGLRFLQEHGKPAKRPHETAPSRLVSLIRPGERISFNESLTFERRGIHRLPDLSITNMFPFHLFQYGKSLKNETTIAITPKLLTGQEDSLSSGLMSALGQFTSKLLQGDALDYTGSREYEVGMPVRRWDFRSWARLGKPIVREFQSPSVQLVTLIVDTSRAEPKRFDPQEYDELLERVLSVAATAVNELARKAITVRLYVTGEPTEAVGLAGFTGMASDSQSLLIRLAAASRIPVSQADRALQELVDSIGNSPALVLTARENLSLPNGLSRHTSVISVSARDLEVA